MKPSEALLDLGKPVAFYPGLVKRLGSVNAVLFFCQIFFHTGKESNPELGIYKTAKEIEEETGLTYDEQKTARKNLRDRGLLVETERRIEHRIYYRLILEVFDSLNIPEQEIPCSGEWDSLGRGEGNSTFVLTESTSERTTESNTYPTSIKTQIEEIYQAYPKHEAKAYACKAIAKVLRIKPYGELLAIVKTYAAKVRREGTEKQYIPLPATWMNGGYYENEDLKPPPQVVASTWDEYNRETGLHFDKTQNAWLNGNGEVV
jgi:hypothetical protein